MCVNQSQTITPVLRHYLGERITFAMISGAKVIHKRIGPSTLLEILAVILHNSIHRRNLNRPALRMEITDIILTCHCFDI